MKYTPSLLPINPGVSLHIVTLFPSLWSANEHILSTKESSTSSAVTTSSKGKYRGGLKKCVIKNLEAISSDIPSTKAERGRVDVLDETIVSGPM